MKAAVDWQDIRVRWMSGESPESIAASGAGLTAQAIRKRALKENWGETAQPEDNRWLAVVTSTERVVCGYKDTPETRARVLQAIELGLPRVHAAEYAGINRDTIADWQAKDPAFSAQLTEAERRFEARHVGNIVNAGDRGDWKASAHLLAKSPATRETWADDKTAGVAIQVVLNIPRAESPPVVTIDQQAAS